MTITSAFKKANWYTLWRYVTDYWYGLDTAGWVPTEKLGLDVMRSNHYSSSASHYLRSLLDYCEVEGDDEIVDFGSGKGGALIEFSKYPFRRIVGVEVSRTLHHIALKNMSQLGIDTVELYCVDAAAFTDLDSLTYAYFDNPFPLSVFEEVMTLIDASLKRRPRRFSILYWNPVFHTTVVKNFSFHKVAELPTEHRFKVFVYRNV